MRSQTASPLLHAMISDLEGVDILPEHMVRLRLTRPSDLTLRASCEIPILPAEPLRAGGAKLAQLGRAPVGTGPFRVAAWERGKRIKLVRSRPTDAPAAPGAGRNPFRDRQRFSPSADSPAPGRNRRFAARARHYYPEQVSQATLRDSLRSTFSHLIATLSSRSTPVEACWRIQLFATP